MRLLLPALLSFFPLLVSAGKLILQSPRVVISDLDANVIRSEPISTTRLPSPPLSLGVTDRLKLTFQILGKESGDTVQPHQVFLRFYDSHTHEEGIQPLRVSSTGKVSFELNLSRPPLSIPPTPNASVPLEVTLLIGSFKHSPLSQHIFDLHLPASYPTPEHPDEPTFHPLPEIMHTFRPEPKTPYVILSAIGTGLVLSPWIFLIGMLSSIPHRLPHLFNPLILLFLGLLVSLEGLLFVYWIKLRLGQVLLYGAILGGITTAAGRSALSKVNRWRVGTT